jgi:hypothetical protein
MDIPTPHHGPSFFEDLHGCADAAAFGKKLFDLATHHCGYPSRTFLARLTSALARDRAGLAAVVASNVAKYEAAAGEITSSRRSVLRVRGYFATVYAVGCLAIRFNILPFTEAELLAAVLSCHRDHVAFVDNQVAKHFGSPHSTPTTSPSLSHATPAATPLASLGKYLFGPAQSSFIDLDQPGATGRGAPANAVFVGRHKGQPEFWLTSSFLETLVGGPAALKALKAQLDCMNCIGTTGQGSTRKFVVKRFIPGRDRQWMVVLPIAALRVGTGQTSGAPRKRPPSPPMTELALLLRRLLRMRTRTLAG